MPEHFDPRQAARNHAGMSQMKIGDESKSKPGPSFVIDATDAASAVACGLIYIGDVLENRLSAIENLLEQLDATVANGLTEIAKELE